MEARAVASALGMASPVPGGPVVGAYEGVNVVHHLIGIRGRAMDALMFKDQPGWAIMAGLAGALDPALGVGDVVIDDCPAQILPPPGVLRGQIHSADQLVSTAAQKSALFAETYAVAVDMETAVVRAWARQRRIPLIAIRAISDAADQSLDPQLLRLVDDWGTPRPAAVARYLAANPLRAMALGRLGRDSKRATERLGQAVRDLVRQIARLDAVR